jgi:hypothetical protein
LAQDGAKNRLKKVGYLRSYGRKTIFDQFLGTSGAILSQNEETSSTIFFIFNTSKMQKKF